MAPYRSQMFLKLLAFEALTSSTRHGPCGGGPVVESRSLCKGRGVGVITEWYVFLSGVLKATSSVLFGPHFADTFRIWRRVKESSGTGCVDEAAAVARAAASASYAAAKSSKSRASACAACKVASAD